MWANLEGNLILDDFNSISAPELLGWYNLSLIQTLLFHCTRLEFTVYEGINMEARAIKGCKTPGLMYNLQREQKDAPKPISFDSSARRGPYKTCLFRRWSNKPIQIDGQIRDFHSEITSIYNFFPKMVTICLDCKKNNVW